jgi:hypothetical protein
LDHAKLTEAMEGAPLATDSEAEVEE